MMFPFDTVDGSGRVSNTIVLLGLVKVNQWPWELSNWTNGRSKVQMAPGIHRLESLGYLEAIWKAADASHQPQMRTPWDERIFLPTKTAKKLMG